MAEAVAHSPGDSSPYASVAAAQHRRPQPKDCAQFIHCGLDEVASELLRWPAVCTAHITHSIESRPTLHTLVEITEALINSQAAAVVAAVAATAAAVTAAFGAPTADGACGAR